MSNIPELHDPESIKGRIQHLISKAKRLSGEVPCVLSDPWLLKKALWKLCGRITVPPPVIDYTKGASGDPDKRALMTYVAWPFYVNPESRLRGHVNGLQSVEIANAFNRLGYIVDIVDWLDNSFIPTNHYDVFFGMHYNFE